MASRAGTEIERERRHGRTWMQLADKFNSIMLALNIINLIANDHGF